MSNRIIFLDTSIFESENYFEGRNINLLFHLSQQNLIDLKITDIVYREIINRLTNNIIKATNLFKTQKISFENDARILRNIKTLKDYFKKVDFKKIKENAVSEIKQKFEEILKNNSIEIIDTSIANIKEITDDYFATKPPFKEGLKKTEFPDAISINTMKLWCIQNSKECFFISNDKDFENYKDKNINCSYNLSSILEFLYKENNDVQFEVISKIYDKLKDEVLSYLYSDSAIVNSLESTVYNHINDDAWYEDVTASFHNVEEIEIEIALINEIKEKEFTYEIEANITFTVEVDYIDLTQAFYDREDDFWLGEERKSGIEKYKTNIIVYPIFNYDLNTITGKFIEFVDYEIRDIEEL